MSELDGAGSAAAREAAGVRLIADAYARWADMPPVTVGLGRCDAWTVLLALQSARSHPAFDGERGASAESWGRQLQEAVCDEAELYAVAERGWSPADPTDVAGDPAAVQLMMDAYTRWKTMAPVSATASRRDVWVVMMALQLVNTHPDIAETAMGRAVESIGRQIQGGVCDDPELYALAEAGWNRAADVESGDRS